MYKDKSFLKNCILVPADFRTSAGNQGNNAYIYWGEGGFSWTIPYIAGLCALGLQIDPTLSYEKMRDFIKGTKSVTPEGYDIINPSAFIKSVESHKK